jgi:hypothetical protein
LKFFVLPAKSLNASGRIDQLLLAGIEGMALGANFDPDFAFCRTRKDLIAAGALYERLMILGVNVFLHLFTFQA